jgi:hypothetical protein
MCLVYNDTDKLNAMSDDELTAHVAKCGAWVEEMVAGGRNPVCGALQAVGTAATVRVRNGSVSVTDGPFAETKEVLAGYTILEARDLTEAVHLASQLDVARVNTVEVRPMLDPEAVVSDPLDRRLVRIIDQIQPSNVVDGRVR